MSFKFASSGQNIGAPPTRSASRWQEAGCPDLRQWREKCVFGSPQERSQDCEPLIEKLIHLTKPVPTRREESSYWIKSHLRDSAFFGFFSGEQMDLDGIIPKKNTATHARMTR